MSDRSSAPVLRESRRQLPLPHAPLRLFRLALSPLGQLRRPLRPLSAWLVRGDTPYLAFNLAATLLTAWSSVTFFHPDEHYQVLEFTSFKLGFTAQSELPWEYAARIRSWLQPAFYFALAAPLVRAGLHDRFALAFVLRLVSGLLAVGALTAMLKVSEPWLRERDARRWRVQFLTFAGFLPYLAVRTSAENLTSSCFLFGLALVMRGRSAEGEPSAPALSGRRAFATGMLFGLAFECRYQSAFMIAGACAWLACVGRVRRWPLASLSLGFVGAVLACSVVDRWGYGEWTFPAYAYAWINLKQGAAASYGTAPWYGYAYALLPNVFGPVVLLLGVALCVCWCRRPRHVVTWCTAPFVLVHCMIAHKEERFMFPIAVLSLLAAALALEPASPQRRPAWQLPERLGAWLRGVRRSRAFRALAAVNFAGLAWLAVYPLGWRPHLAFYRWLDDVLAVDPGARFVSCAPERIPDYPFYRRASFRIERPDAIARDVRGRTLFWIAPEPFSAQAAQGTPWTLVYSEFPGWQSAVLRAQFPRLARVHAWLASELHMSERLVWLSAYQLSGREPRVLASCSGAAVAADGASPRPRAF